MPDYPYRSKTRHSCVRPVPIPNDEAIALYAHTNCYPPFYKELNTELRNGNSNNFIVKLIDSALAKLPIYSAQFVYRWSIPTIDEQQQLNSNQIITNKAYLSTIKSPNRLTMAEFDCWLIEIEHLNGRDISLFSDDFSIDIQEVLIPRDAQLSLNANRNTDYDLHLLQVS